MEYPETLKDNEGVFYNHDHEGNPRNIGDIFHSQRTWSMWKVVAQISTPGQEDKCFCIEVEENASNSTP